MLSCLNSIVDYFKSVFEVFLSKFEKYIWNPMVKHYKITIPMVLLSPLLLKGIIALFQG